MIFDLLVQQLVIIVIASQDTNNIEHFTNDDPEIVIIIIIIIIIPRPMIYVNHPSFFSASCLLTNDLYKYMNKIDINTRSI